MLGRRACRVAPNALPGSTLEVGRFNAQLATPDTIRLQERKYARNAWREPSARLLWTRARIALLALMLLSRPCRPALRVRPEKAPLPSDRLDAFSALSDAIRIC
jgi:hypothetical protein